MKVWGYSSHWGPSLIILAYFGSVIHHYGEMKNDVVHNVNGMIKMKSVFVVYSYRIPIKLREKFIRMLMASHA